MLRSSVESRRRPCGASSFSLLRLGTYVPGYHMPPLSGWGQAARSAVRGECRKALHSKRTSSVLNRPPLNLTIATTGASGVIFLRQLLLAVERDQRIETVNFIASDS